MKKNLGKQSALCPMPVLIVATWNEDGTPDAMNAAWGGIHDTDQIGVCIAPEHRTAANLLRTESFTVSIGTADTMVSCDYVGIVSGNKVPDKVAMAGWHVDPSSFVDAPVIRELPLVLECRLVSYDRETGCAVGDIVNVAADESVLGPDGKVDVDLLGAISFDPFRNRYIKIGGVAGTAFSVGTALLKK
ncbi:MAG: flavin reductase [Victivallaceae bacterium]|nr:flavin reductase [Victivallaceae bacterium]